MALKCIEKKERYSTRVFYVATRADVISLQEATGSILGAIGSVMGSHRKLEPDDVRGAFSSGDAEDGWEDCRLNALWNDDLLHLIRVGFSNMKHEDYPQSSKGTVVGFKIDGGNDHKTLHTGKRKRQKWRILRRTDYSYGRL